MENNCVTHFACDCITRKLIEYDKMSAEIVQLKLDNDHLQLLKQEYFNKIAALKSKLEIAKKALQLIADDASKPIESISGYFIGEETLDEVERSLKEIEG